MRRAGLLVIAALAWLGATAADARLRGEVRSSTSGLGTGMAAHPTPAPRPSAPAPAPQATPTPVPTPAPALPRAVQARTYDRDEERLQLTLSRPAVAAGEVRVEFNNALAEDPHDLRVERVDGAGEPFAFAVLGPGEVAAQRLALSPGEWRFSCTLFDHAERGMTAVLRVGASARASVRRRG